MIYDFIKYIREMSNLDFGRFINFLKQNRVYPDFINLYDNNDYKEDLEYFKNLWIFIKTK